MILLCVYYIPTRLSSIIIPLNSPSLAVSRLNPRAFPILWICATFYFIKLLNPKIWINLLSACLIIASIPFETTPAIPSPLSPFYCQRCRLFFFFSDTVRTTRIAAWTLQGFRQWNAGDQLLIITSPALHAEAFSCARGSSWQQS